jgi:hypothetical protein
VVKEAYLSAQTHNHVLLFLAILILAIVMLGLCLRKPCWPILRQIAGWLCIVLGLFGLILPGPGTLLLILGLTLIGWHPLLLRRGWIVLRCLLRSWAHQPGLRGWIGVQGGRLARSLAIEVRHLRRRISAPL